MSKDSKKEIKKSLPLEKYLDEITNTDRIIYEYKEKALKEAYDKVKQYKEYNTDELSEDVILYYVTEDGIEVKYSNINGKEKITVDLEALEKYAEEMNKKYGNEYVTSVKIKNKDITPRRIGKINNVIISSEPSIDMDGNNAPNQDMNYLELTKNNGMHGFWCFLYTFFKPIYIMYLILLIYNLMFSVYSGRFYYTIMHYFSILDIEGKYMQVCTLVVSCFLNLLMVIVLRMICGLLDHMLVSNNVDYVAKPLIEVINLKFIGKTFLSDFLYFSYIIKYMFDPENTELETFVEKYLSYFDTKCKDKYLFGIIKEKKSRNVITKSVIFDSVYIFLMIMIAAILSQILSIRIPNPRTVLVVFISISGILAVSLVACIISKMKINELLLTIELENKEK